MSDGPGPTVNQALIVDVKATIHTLKVIQSKKSPTKYKYIVEQLLKIIVRRVPHSAESTIYFTNDTYPEVSPKNAERSIRAESTGGSFATTIRSREQLVDSQFKKSFQDKPLIS